MLARAVLTRREPEMCAGVMKRIERDEDRVTGDYSQFWRDRDYLPGARNVKAQRLRHPRAQRLERQDHAVRPVVGRARQGRREAPSLAPPRRARASRRPTPGATPSTGGSTTTSTGSATARTARPWPRSSAGTELSTPHAAGRIRAPATSSSDLAPGRLTTGDDSNAKESFVDKRRHAHRRRARQAATDGRPQPPRVPHAAAHSRCPAQRHSEDRAARQRRQPHGRQPHGAAGGLLPGRHAEDRQPRMDGRAEPRLGAASEAGRAGTASTRSAGRRSPRTTSSPRTTASGSS